MLYICRVHSQAKDTRITIPARLCREFNIKNGTQFKIFAKDLNTLIFHRVQNNEFIEDNQLIDNIKTINYGEQNNS